MSKELKKILIVFVAAVVAAYTQMEGISGNRMGCDSNLGTSERKRIH